MSILDIFRQIFLLSDCEKPDDTSLRRRRSVSKDKHIIVMKNGLQKRYCINKYGEVYED